MRQLLQRLLTGVAFVAAVNSASAFSLFGDFAVDDAGAVWQVERIGYVTVLGDVGGPMNLGEEFRWNIRTITYGFDSSFWSYFGPNGVNAVRQAIAMLNAVPPVSQMSSDLSEFPLDTRRFNFQASALGITDLKTVVLGFLLEQMGLAHPEKYVWTLRSRVQVGNIVTYTVFRRNFDPARNTLFPLPSSYVNGVLYTFGIFEFAPNPTFADAVEIPVDPLAFAFTSVASIPGDFYGNGAPNSGEFVTGLTRDDAGSLRYIYRPENRQFENLLAGTTGGNAEPWGIPGQTNLLVDLALRPGVDKVAFQEAAYDGLFGNFVTTTNQYTDTYVTNGTVRSQNTQRVLATPDIVFTASDLGVDTGGIPVFIRRTTAAAWANNDPINGQETLSGPGVILPQVVIALSSVGPYLVGQDPGFLDQATAVAGLIWGSFDGTTNAPIVYPDGSSIEDL